MKPCDEEDLTVCPSFNSYSAAAEVAGRVSFEVAPPPEMSPDGGDKEEEDDFEFVSLSANPDGEFFIDGCEIRPIFPVFDGDLASDPPRDAAEDGKSEESSIRIPLKSLFIDDRDPPSSSSCSEADELERISPGVYCFWTPKLEDSPPRRCEKSNSTGSSTAATVRRSKWQKFRDLLKRSNSEGGKGSSLVFLTPSDSKRLNPIPKEKKSQLETVGTTKAKSKTTSSSAHEKLYVRNRKMREEDKRRSYLPYRQDLVGFFASVNGAGRPFAPF